MANFITCHAWNQYRGESTVDLIGAGRHHARSFWIAVELTEHEADDFDGGAELTVEAFQVGKGTQLLFSQAGARGRNWQNMILLRRKLPPGVWLLDLRLGGHKLADRLIGVSA